MTEQDWERLIRAMEATAAQFEYCAPTGGAVLAMLAHFLRHPEKVGPALAERDLVRAVMDDVDA